MTSTRRSSTCWRNFSRLPDGPHRDAAPGAPADRPVPQLLAMGLLRRLDAETVILPRHVGQVLRGEQPGPLQLSAPDPVVSTTTAEDADAAAAGAVIDLLRELDVLLETLSAAPVSELRNGRLGVREVKRLSKTTGIDEQRLGLILEVAAAAGLIASGMPDPEPATGEAPYWAPTTAADRFAALSTAERWQLLAGSWLDLPGRPALIGGRGPDGNPTGAHRRPVLHGRPAGPAAAARHAVRAAARRRRGRDLGVGGADLATAPLGQAVAARTRRGPAPRSPRPGPGRARGDQHPARALLEEDADPQAAIDAMARALPKPVDHFLVQADLTVVVPGPLQRDLAEELATVATVESAGAAMVYRVSEQSIRHALDIGKTRDWMHAFFADHSKTPVPQGLTYLIDDVARRHGQLRIGMAASFVRCEDPALLAQAVAAPRPRTWRCAPWPPPSRCRRRPSARCSRRCGPPASPRRPRTPPAPSSTCVRAAPGWPRRSSAGPTGPCAGPTPRACTRWSRCCAGSPPHRSATSASTRR